MRVLPQHLISAKLSPGPVARPRRLPYVHSTIRVTRETWTNWSKELTCKPKRLYCDDARGPYRSPRTLGELQDIVRDARAEGVAIRMFGSSHSWSKLVPNHSGYLVDNRMIATSEGRFLVHLEPAREGRKARATVPPGMLSSEFEHWLWEQGYSMPSSAFEDCFTVGGMAATATHGAGIDIGTVSDMVVGMTFVDGQAQVRHWDRETCSEDELAAIQCGLGCLGLIHTITFEVEPAYETFHTATVVPYDSLFADTDAARAALRELHETHDSIEFFWWPFRFSGTPMLSRPEINPDVWILATRRDIPEDAEPRSRWTRFKHLMLLDMVNMSAAGRFLHLVRKYPRLAPLLPFYCGFTNLWVDQRCGAYRMPQYDANHFVNAAGVEFMTAMATEWSVPFYRREDPNASDGYERVRRSFAMLHDRVVEAFERYPLRDPRSSPIVTAVEMRTLNASSALLSPGYAPGDAREQVFIAAPEIVTTSGHPAWEDFAQAANIAMTTDPVLGDQVRSHQGKPAHAWPHPDFPQTGMRGYLREQYRRAGTWDRFLAVRAQVDPDGVFLNDYLREWFEL